MAVGTLADLKARVAAELRRDDLTTEIADAITDAIAVYQKERFRFSENPANAEPSFDTVINQETYTVTDNANIGTAMGIDYVNIAIGLTQVRLIRAQPEDLHLYNQTTTMRGQPGWFAYQGNQLMLSPIPSQVWTVTLGLFLVVAAPASDAEANNKWMTDGERLIRARAKYEIATHVTRNPTMAQAMSPSPPQENGGVVGAAYREWKSLKSEGSRITSSGRIRAMSF